MCDKKKNLQDEVLANLQVCFEELRFFRSNNGVLLITAFYF